ncbi:hypothetical protein CTAYLR_002555 [Chrysophaeum taylorii]|uniref:ubiquitinyl hydrolase 1 n=1 Tax=Chrysophaeum taylorii TaxID=2483200 RepID=A0AAD7UFU6_9STRA|nr:hypothetical protein CTAYLR_002555 [Chrysophaeum taylorii]
MNPAGDDSATTTTTTTTEAADGDLQRALEASLRDVGTMSAQEQDRLTIDQLNDIVATIAQEQPMVGAKVGISEALAAEYAENPMKGFALGIDILNAKYSAMRRVRKDGNCFYRGFLYRYLEALVLAQQQQPTTIPELVRIREVVKGSKKKLLDVGYDESAMDMFWEMFAELLDQVPSLTPDALHLKLNDEQGVSNHVVWFCRALSATQIKLNADRFAPFIMGEDGLADVDKFCRTEVEPVNHECEQVQIIALTEMLQVPVTIEYLDASGHPSSIVFPEGAHPTVKLLYRPGHYDILYDTTD